MVFSNVCVISSLAYQNIFFFSPFSQFVTATIRVKMSLFHPFQHGSYALKSMTCTYDLHIQASSPVNFHLNIFIFKDLSAQTFFFISAKQLSNKKNPFV